MAVRRTPQIFWKHFRCLCNYKQGRFRARRSMWLRAKRNLQQIGYMEWELQQLLQREELIAGLFRPTILLCTNSWCMYCTSLRTYATMQGYSLSSGILPILQKYRKQRGRFYNTNMKTLRMPDTFAQWATVKKFTIPSPYFTLVSFATWTVRNK